MAVQDSGNPTLPGARLSPGDAAFERLTRREASKAKDDAAYALVFEGGDVEAQLQALTLKRLQETLAFPIPDAWAKTLWEYALDAEYIQRLVTGGDCRGGVRLDLSKPWQDLVQNLLEQEVLKI